MIAIATYKYFSVLTAPEPPPGRKTRDYEIISPTSGIIGRIAWYGPWRQFCFEPLGNTVWSDSCLKDLRTALTAVKQHHKGASQWA